MQSWRFGAGLLLLVAACAVQNNPLPDTSDDDDDDVGGSSAGGKTSSAGKSAGGTQASSGSSQGGKSGDGSGGDMEDRGGGGSGGKGGSSNGGSAGKATGGTTAGTGGTASGGKGGTSNTAGTNTGGASAGGTGGTNSGGTSAGGGGSGGGGSTCTPLNAGNLAGISARFEKEGDDDYSLAGKLIIANVGPNTLNLADLKLRYYFTNEVTAALQKTINWCYYRPNGGGAQEDRTGKVSFDVVPMTCKPTGADTYLEFKFTADAGLLEPGKQIYFSWAVHNTASQKFTKTNDYSYDASATEGNDFTKVVVLQNSGSRIWGTEP